MSESRRVLSTYDFTLICDEQTPVVSDIIKGLSSYSKKFVFQLELGDSGYKHYQGRILLIKKSTLSNTIKNLQSVLPRIHISITSNDVHKRGSFNYVLKAPSRIDGPWSDQDEIKEPLYIPIQYRVNLRQWQSELYELLMSELDKGDYRNVHILYDPEGNKGKTTFGMYLTTRGLGEYIPPLNDAKDIMRLVYCLPVSKLYIFDLTRSMCKEKLFGMYSAIEQIKNGYLYDDRYTFKRKFIDSPAIIVMTNEIPNKKYLSSDRFKFHMVDDDKLINIVPDDIFNDNFEFERAKASEE